MNVFQIAIFQSNEVLHVLEVILRGLSRYSFLHLSQKSQPGGLSVAKRIAARGYWRGKSLESLEYREEKIPNFSLCKKKSCFPFCV